MFALPDMKHAHLIIQQLHCNDERMASTNKRGNDAKNFLSKSISFFQNDACNYSHTITAFYIKMYILYDQKGIFMENDIRISF